MPTRPQAHRPRGYRPPDRHRDYNHSRRDMEAQRFYTSAAWRRFRAAVLAEQPLCEDCLAETPPRMTPATQLDHVQTRRQRPDLELDPGNVRCLCASHHSRKTCRQDGAFGRQRTLKADKGGVQ